MIPCSVSDHSQSTTAGTHPSDHDPAHPLARCEPLERHRRERLKHHVRVVEDAEDPRPLRRSQVAELALDVRLLLEVHDGRVADVADMHPHDEVHKAVPQQQAVVDLAVSAFERCCVKLGIRVVRRCLDRNQPRLVLEGLARCHCVSHGVWWSSPFRLPSWASFHAACMLYLPPLHRKMRRHC